MICVAGTDVPSSIVISESMEPTLYRGDLCLNYMSKSPISTGEIILFKVKSIDMPIVHRVIKVRKQNDTGDHEFLTKGDNNILPDSFFLYDDGQQWLQQRQIVARNFLIVPYVGYIGLIMKTPIVKYFVLAWYVHHSILAKEDKED